MSDFLNFSVQTRDDFKDWILTMLGEPLITVELTDKHLEIAINNATEEFSKWVTQEQQYFGVDLSGYVQGVGYTMPSNVTGIFAFSDDFIYARGGINTLFSIPNLMWNAGLIPNFAVGKGDGWVTYELAMESLKLNKWMTGKGFQFEYNPRSKQLTLIPDPIMEKVDGVIVCGCYTLRPESQQYGESMCRRLALAEAKIMLGQIRQKFDGVQLLGGGNLNAGIKDEGIAERDALLAEIRTTEGGPAGFWVG